MMKRPALAALLIASPAMAQPALLVVASAHFANPGRDNINIRVEDVLTPQRQREI